MASVRQGGGRQGRAVEAPQQNALSRLVWTTRYRHGDERSVADTWRRVASAAAARESTGRERQRRAFLRAFEGFKLLPGGRILAGAGTRKRVTLANCFVSGTLDDSLDTMFERLKEGAVTMQWGGGIGCDFSPLQPAGADSPGPVAQMRIWDAMCESLSTVGARRGAMMGTLRCDHPDIAAFVAAKCTPSVLRNFNLSVLVTDGFMHALRRDAPWRLRPPGGNGGTERVEVRARELWRQITDAAYESAEPGVLFIDRLNAENNLHYCERIVATNPCGEVPLPANGACHLASLNLPAFVRDAFGLHASFDVESFVRAAAVAVRLLDDVVDASDYPLEAQAQVARATRRVGLGVTGLGDGLAMLGLRYDEEAGRAAATAIVTQLRDAAYSASVELAAEKGTFPAYRRDAYLTGRFVGRLPAPIRDAIARHGIRNSHLLAIAPAGTISLLANNVSSGVEPIFALEGRRRVGGPARREEVHGVTDFAYAAWREVAAGGGTPRAFVTAAEISPEAHLAMLAALTPLVDNSISKTINVPESIPREQLVRLYERAYDLGAKGCTVFRPTASREAVLADTTDDCCAQGRRVR